MTHYQESRSLKRFIRTTLAKFTLSKVPANDLKNALIHLRGKRGV